MNDVRRCRPLSRRALNHPNILAIYDIGTVSENGLRLLLETLQRSGSVATAGGISLIATSRLSRGSRP